MTNTGNGFLSGLAVRTKRNRVELKKHVGAIHSSNYLTLVQRKIANALLYNAYNGLEDQEEHQIHIADLCKLIGYDSKDSKQIKQSLVALISTVIEWNLLDDKNESNVWNASSIIADASIDGPVCSYSYSPKMRRLLHSPEVYGRLNMQVQARFKSSYGLALYENCIRYQNIKQTPWFDIVTFRKLMGVKDGRYPIFRDFKRRVLDSAISEVNIHAPIFVQVNFRKQGRKVTAMQFTINQQELLVRGELSANDSLPGKLGDQFGFSKSQIDQIIIDYDEPYIREKIALIETSTSFRQGKIKNLAKYLDRALKDDFKPAKSSHHTVENNRQLSEEKNRERKKLENQFEQYRKYKNKEILKNFGSLTAKEQGKLEKEFCLTIEKTAYYSSYKRQGLGNVLVSDKLCEFISLNRSDLIQSILPFKQYVDEGGEE